MATTVRDPYASPRPIRRFTYAKLPDGFEQRVAPQPLEPCRCYILEVDGPGWSRRLDFVVSDSGDLLPLVRGAGGT